MSAYLAVESALRGSPAAWQRLTFKRVTALVKEANGLADQPLLSLASSGRISVRTEMGGLGRQAPSEVTIMDYWKVRPSQVVVNPMWLVGGSVGVSDVAGAVSPAYRVYDVAQGTHPRFMHYLLRSYPYMEQYRLLGRGDTTFDRSVGREDFEGLPLVLPPLEQQRRIADFLDDQVSLLDRAIELRRQQPPLFDARQWASLLADVLATRPRRVAIRRLLTFITDGPFGSAFTSADYVSNGAFVVRLGNIGFAEFRSGNDAFIPDEVWARFPRCHVKSGDLLIAGLGDNNNHAGRAAVAPDLGPALVKGKCFCARVDDGLVSADYLALMLSSPLGADLLAQETRGSTRGMINLEIVKSVLLPFPGRDDQEHIVGAGLRRRADTAMAIGMIERQSSLLTERKQALITAAVTGRFDVTTARTVA